MEIATQSRFDHRSIAISQRPRHYLSKSCITPDYPVCALRHLHIHLSEFNVRLMGLTMNSALMSNLVTRDTGLAREVFRRSGLHIRAFRHTATGEKTACRCEDGSYGGNNVSGAGDFSQKRSITGEIGTNGRSAGFDPRPHDHVYNRAYGVQSNASFRYGITYR